MKRIAVVIVTYNRKKLLLECLEAVCKQNYNIEKIYLIDNASTDGTESALKKADFLNNPKLEYIKMKENTGGAGGFYEGLKIAGSKEYDFYWIMDDDTIPMTDSLNELVNAYEFVIEQNKYEKDEHISRLPSFMASAVYGANGEYMNVPCLNESPSSNGYGYWYRFLGQSMVSIKNATFVSLLIPDYSLKKCGLPCKEFFIWGDDIEYTERLYTYVGDGYFVGKSKVIHKRFNAKSLDIRNEEDVKRIKMMYLNYRNSIVRSKYYHDNKLMLKLTIACVKSFLLLKTKNGFIKMLTIWKGYFCGLLFYRRFKKLIDAELQKNCLEK